MSNLGNIIGWIAEGRQQLESFPWTCPFCQRATTITDRNREHGLVPLTKENVHGERTSVSVFVVCPNPECKEFAFYIFLYVGERGPTGHIVPSEPLPIEAWQLIPASEAKTYPDYVPKPIRDDYTEACLIRDLSPKASATLARRCLQGMIRDFYKVREPNLYKEIEAIKDKVAPLTWQAIQAVRSVANVGAHMEKDINVIVEVESGEAAMLIGLIETLIDDWYITRHDREERLKGIVALKDAKERARESRPGSS